MNKQYLLNRLAEPSTWRGLVMVATSFGVLVKPEQIEAIVFVGLFIAGMMGAVTKDSKPQ